MKTPDKILLEAAKTFAEKGKVYGSNYYNAGEALNALFPEGLTLKTIDDHVRFQIFSLICVKLSRYAVRWEQRHQDSIRDATVYCAILESLDDEIGERG